MESRLFLDSASIKDAALLCKSDAIGGVTTNPSLISKERKSNYVVHLAELATALNGNKHLSVEVLTSDPQYMFSEARSLHEVLGHQNLYIKIPVMLETLPVITKLSEAGISVNATACMTTGQALLAAAAGARIVSFFYNRMKDWAGEKWIPPQNDYSYVGIKFVTETKRDHVTKWALAQISQFKELNSDTKVICGSIRSPDDVLECWKAGADYVTASKPIITELISHPKTTEAIEQFRKDIEEWQS